MSKEMEMSTIVSYYPRFYKGYDVDELITKMRNQKSLTQEEDNVLLEVQEKYTEIEHKRRHKEAKKIREESLKAGLFLGRASINYCGGSLK